MAIKTIEYKVNIAGITPATEQFGGTQGDHRVTSLSFALDDYLHDTIEDAAVESGGKPMYRFDVYDGEGGIWSSDAAELTENIVSIELEERHTRHGGKITVYLVITALSADNETQAELYSFPAVIRLKNRPEGTYQDGENYESVTSLAEVARGNALAAEKSNKELQAFAADIEEKLKNGEFDGVGVESAVIINDELIIKYTDGKVQNLGNVKGDTGPQGEKGDKGDDGKDAVTDQTYNPESENAQSGKAVAEAIPKNKILDYLTYTITNHCVTITDCDQSISGAHVIPDIIEDCPVTSIGKQVFSFCNELKSITIPNSVINIEHNVFVYCDGLTNITIPNSITSISKNMFAYCDHLTNITIPNSVTNIEPGAFQGCANLKSITIPDSVTSIGHNAFQRCTNLKSATIPDSVTIIDSSTFRYCGLTNITIPNSVTSIGSNAFAECTNLKSITIPDSVTSIGYKAFNGCSSLTDIYYTGTQEQWSQIFIDNIEQGNYKLLNATIHYNQAFATKGYVDGSVSERIPKPIAFQEFFPRLLMLKPGFDSYTPDGSSMPDSAFDFMNVDDGIWYDKSSVILAYGMIPTRDSKGNLWTGEPVEDEDCVPKKYLDDLVGDIETLLGGI